MSDRSLIAFEHLKDARQRFDHLVLGLTGALCAYVGEHLTPERLGFNAYSIELTGLLLLIVSACAGFVLLQSRVHGHLLNHRQLHYGEVRGELQLAAREGNSFVNTNSGELFNREQALGRIAFITQELPKIATELDALHARVKWLIRGRDGLLLIGFCVVLVGRVVTPYFC